MTIDRKRQKFFFILTAFLILFLSLLLWKTISANSPDSPDGPPPGINIGVCVDPPSPDLTNPSQPIFRWSTSGNPQAKYWLKVDNSGATFPSPEINSGAVSSGNKFHQVSLGQLVQNKTYWYCVAVADSYGWTGWTGCNSFLLPNRPPSAKDLTISQNYCALTANLTWTFNDPDYGDSQTAYQIQVDNNSNFSSPEIDTEKLNFPSSFYLIDIRGLLSNTTYYWQLKVWDTIGPDSSDWVNGPSFVTPKHQGPAVDFDWSPGLLMPDDAVRIQFFDRSTVFGGTTKSNWFWTFESGNPPTSISQDPSVSFTSSVSQSDVTLRVTDSDGYACEATKTVDIIGLRIKLREVIPR